MGITLTLLLLLKSWRSATYENIYWYEFLKMLAWLFYPCPVPVPWRPAPWYFSHVTVQSFGHYLPCIPTMPSPVLQFPREPMGMPKAWWELHVEGWLDALFHPCACWCYLLAGSSCVMALQKPQSHWFLGPENWGQLSASLNAFWYPWLFKLSSLASVIWG